MASHGIRYAQGLQVVPLEGPADITADAESEWVELENMQWVSFLVICGKIGVSDTINVAVKSTTSATSGTTNANDYALPFDYRKSSAVGDDDWGAITSVTTATGYVQITAADDDKLFLIDIDPAVVAAHDSDAKYLYLDWDVTDSSSTDTATIVGAVGVFEPRYPQNEQVSSSA
jgi:hypothetical protein